VRKREMRAEDVSKLLQKQCQKAGGQRAFARAHGLLVQHISQVVRGERPPSKGLCDALGIEPAGMRWVAKRKG
jgi:DNA-binding transcriptional regulator YdaS (Cro superfamily)